ncbi:hypothetical protein Goe5_c02690 [Bacillus phage vB_BthM-Goe5]|nr:hypothetical protein Goe5_c02690 [Bacillus phage vB_BthM-Goe5]
MYVKPKCYIHYNNHTGLYDIVQIDNREELNGWSDKTLEEVHDIINNDNYFYWYWVKEDDI